MKTLAAKFTFTVPDAPEGQPPHPDQGKTFERAFNFEQCENEEEAVRVLAAKKLSVLEMVNNKLKQNARSNSYQAALLPYKPSEVPAEDIKERMVRDYIRLGKTEEQARRKVEKMLASDDE